MHFSLGNVTVLCGRGELETSDELFRFCAIICGTGAGKFRIMAVRRDMSWTETPREPGEVRSLASAPKVSWPVCPHVLMSMWAVSASYSDPKGQPCRAAAQAPEALCPQWLCAVFLHWASQCSCFHGTEVTDLLTEWTQKGILVCSSAGTKALVVCWDCWFQKQPESSRPVLSQWKISGNQHRMV